jgi:hypothetical protein
LDDLTGGHGTDYPSLLNNGIVSYRAFDDNRKSNLVTKDYSVSAHELAHILLNSPHNFVYGDILCGGPTCKGTHITPEDCEKARKTLNENQL